MNKQPGKQSDNPFVISVSENGPYLISSGVPLVGQVIVLDADGQCLVWRETSRYTDRRNYSLCRCGKSNKKPFCDGPHRKIEFDGTETASHQQYMDRCENLMGPLLRLTDAKDLCADAGFCDRAGGIWNLVLHLDNPKAKELAIEEAFNCPSGRLVVWNKQGKAIEPTLVPSLGIVESPDGEFSGPIWVKGFIPIASTNSAIYEIRNRVTLCGCARSSNKPFCDSTHRRNVSQ